MATIDTMTDSGQPHPAQPATPQPPAPATPPPEPPAATADAAQDRVGTARQPRPLLIPLPTAVTAALVAGLFGLLYLNLNGLSDDINGLRNEMNGMNGRIDALRSDTNSSIDTLRNEMNGRIDGLDAKIDNKVDSLRNEMLAVLLDHTDRLSRIETHLDLRPHTDATSP